MAWIPAVLKIHAGRILDETKVVNRRLWASLGTIQGRPNNGNARDFILSGDISVCDCSASCSRIVFCVVMLGILQLFGV